MASNMTGIPEVPAKPKKTNAVVQVIAVAQPPRFWYGGTKISNVWYLNLKLNSDCMFVIRAVPIVSVKGLINKEGYMGNIKEAVYNINMSSFLTSTYVAHSIAIDVQPGKIVKDFTSAIWEKGYFNFDLSKDCTGCRSWTTQVLNLWYQKHLIADPSEACHNILRLWSANGSDHGELSMDTVTFYPIAKKSRN